MAGAKKTTTRKTTRKSPPPVEAYRCPRSVRITEAENGLTVSCYGDKGEEIMVAKSHNEAMRHAKKMLGGTPTAKKGKK